MNSQQNFYGQGQLPSASRGYIAAHALTAALSNPYAHAQQLYYPQASHYAQAYAAHQGTPNATYGYGATTAGGYTISSTYVPSPQHTFQNEQLAGLSSRPQSRPHHGQTQQVYWYQPGSCRCMKAGCTFTGSNKAVEIHMMDRHLIYPPGWENKKRKSDWDADPSLKGYVGKF